MSDDVKGVNKGAVMVTTAHRGVFFGYMVEDDAPRTVRLDRARMCVMWSTDVRGVLGLASHGPSNTCRVTRALGDVTTLYDITSVTACTAEAAAAWERGPWS